MVAGAFGADEVQFPLTINPKRGEMLPVEYVFSAGSSPAATCSAAREATAKH